MGNRPYIARIESNVKGGVGTDLGEKTLIIGPNGSGKSAIINAVELAVTGRASDIAGRLEVAREADLLSLAPGREGHLFAAAKLSDGTFSEYRTEGSTAKAKKAQHKTALDADHVLPLREVMEAVRGSADTARKFFLKRVSSTVTDEDVLAQIPEMLRKMYGVATLQGFMGSTPVDKLLLAKEYATRESRSAKAKVKAGREAATAVASGLPPPPSTAEIESVSSDLRSWRGHLETVIKAQQQKQLAADLATAKNDLEEAEGVLAIAERTHAALPRPTPLTDLQRTAIAALSQIVKAGVDNCFTCGTQGISAAKFKERDAKIKAVVQDIIAKEQVIHASERALDNAKRGAIYARQRVTDIAKIMGAEIRAEHDEAECRAQISALEAQLSALKEARAAWTAAQKANDASDNGASEAEAWGALATACGEAIERILDKALAGFTKKVQANLPAGDVFGLTLRDGEREVCQVGLVRNGVLHTALSGAEWARVTAALAAACAPESGPSIIVPEERAFDADTLTAVCKAMSDIDGQVLLASPVAPRNVPDGWTVVYTGKKVTA